MKQPASLDRFNPRLAKAASLGLAVVLVAGLVALDIALLRSSGGLK